MVYLANLEGPGLVFTYGLFGVQHEELTAEKKKTISALYGLLSQSADRVDHLQDESHGAPREGPKCTTFVAYWLKSSDYEKWKETDEVKQFWDSLPDDAGVWREVMTVPKSRYMFAANQHETSGLATMLGLKDSTDEAYWGVYRHRLSANPDEYTDPNDTFSSPLVTTAKAKPDPSKKVVDLSKSPTPDKIRRGRVKINNIPDNLCYCREGQRQPNLPPEELETWKEKLAPYALTWMNHLDTERNKNGVVSFTFNIAHLNPKPTLDPGADLEVDTDAVAETNQLMYLLDLAHFELAGRSFKDHVHLRKTTFEMYGPGGRHGENGKLSIWVELCILKSGDMDAEYVGCREGTGLMMFENV
ncbi:uncharacterized protein A1O5_13108 [Cladophialophora psammophila CBS 110553]|uniref:Phenylacetaldoxime dehydratase n=1 Tax=Cladophialophora psammophila CBS 110553 TaxID=1182543 RepID=W9VNE9_9EURO|nr:uncharacterized protein A1O5_13108 [Cladophialophora psammophila CBS 110553]EXJ53656.1 hypothetical protein A1O5_13108 [Cladophialophora psammophila CBS 110553]